MQKVFTSSIQTISDILKYFSIRDLIGLFLKNALYINQYYVLEFNLNTLAATPPRKLGGSDAQLLLNDELEELYQILPSLGPDDKRELLSRILFLKKGFKNCYIIKADSLIAYLQWIIYPSENDIIQKHYKRKFLQLSKNQVMFENAFTLPAYRGRGFLPFMTWELMKMAKEQGCKRTIIYVRKDKINSLNTFMQIGFKIKKIVREYKLFGFGWRAL